MLVQLGAEFNGTIWKWPTRPSIHSVISLGGTTTEPGAIWKCYALLCACRLAGCAFAIFQFSGTVGRLNWQIFSGVNVRGVRRVYDYYKAQPYWRGTGRPPILILLD